MFKKITSNGILTPHLYYNREIDFAHSPRPNDEWLNSFYARQGANDSKNIEARLMYATSKAMSVTAK